MTSTPGPGTGASVPVSIPAAAAAERSQRLQWLQEMQHAFGDGATRAAIVAQLGAARQAALEAGIGAQNSGRPLQEALDRFQSIQFDATITAIRTLTGVEDPVSALPDYGRGRANAVAAGTALRAAAAQFLEVVERNLESFGGDQTARAGEVAKSIAEIDGALGGIADDLAAMEALHAA